VKAKSVESQAQIGKAGDPLPPFRNHMIRQRVTRHGAIFPLAPASELPGCCMAPDLIGVPKEGPVGKWLQARQHWDTRYASVRTKVHKRRIKDIATGYETFGDRESPPPSALAGRRKIGADLTEKKKKRSYGLSLWSLWGSKHDEATVVREQEADKEPEVKTATAAEGSGARAFTDIEAQRAPAPVAPDQSRSRSRRRLVRDEHQADGEGDVDENTSVAELIAIRKETKKPPTSDFLSPEHALDVGVTGKRPYVDGIAVPFSLNKEAETASMVTLQSEMPASQVPTPRPMSPQGIDEPEEEAVEKGKEKAVVDDDTTKPGEAIRPTIETFVTAAEELPTVSSGRS